MNNRLYLLALIACLGLAVPPRAQAQTEFRPGYIVRPAGDTVRGLVDYRSGLRNARICQFRPSATAEVVSFGPDQLRGYGFPNSKSYEARVLARADSAGMEAAGRKAFLEVLAAGPVTLYLLASSTDQEQFYLATDVAGPAQKLLYAKTLVTENSRSYYRENNRYRGTLAAAFAACPASQQEAASVPFKLSALTKAVQRYNSCVGTGDGRVAAAALERRRSRLALGLLAGVGSSRMVFGDEQTTVVGGVTGTLAPVAGVALHYSLPALNERLALRLEALYESQKYDGELNTNTYYFGYDKASFQASAAYLRLPLLVRYALPGQKLRPFFQAGLCYSFLLSHTQAARYRYAATGGGYGYTPAQPINPIVRSYELSPVVSLGLQLPDVAGRPLQVEARAERGGGMLAADNFDNYVLRYFLLLGYTLTK